MVSVDIKDSHKRLTGLDVFPGLHVKYGEQQLGFDIVGLFPRNVGKLHHSKILSAVLGYLKGLVETPYNG